jgi:predicted DsbA family dithiol-disulfide isomerase
MAVALTPEIAVEVNWRPYFLNQWIPREGIDRQTYLETKFGSPGRYAAIAERVAAAAAIEGLPFAIDKISRQPNTLDCYRLILWSRSATDPAEMKQRLMELYFAEGADLSDPKTLIRAAVDCGMDGDLVRRLLASDADADRVENEANSAKGSRHRRRAVLHLRRQPHRHRRPVAGISRQRHSSALPDNRRG